MGCRLFKLFAPPASVQQSPWSVNSQNLCTTKYKQNTQKGKNTNSMPYTKTIGNTVIENKYKKCRNINSMQKSIKTSVSQPPRSIKNTEQRPRLEIISLWLCGADCEDWVCSSDEESQSHFPSSCPSLLLLGKQSNSRQQTGSHTGQPGKLLQVGKHKLPVTPPWQTEQLGNQASYHKLAN